MRSLRLSLSRLRAIGWTYWDPIGIRAIDGRDDWHQFDESAASEYDDYLRRAAKKLNDGVSAPKVVAYLVEIETLGMGLGKNGTTQTRAEATVAAMLADDQL